jgi:hypothetical protein
MQVIFPVTPVTGPILTGAAHSTIQAAVSPSDSGERSDFHCGLIFLS